MNLGLTINYLSIAWRTTKTYGTVDPSVIGPEPLHRINENNLNKLDFGILGGVGASFLLSKRLSIGTEVNINPGLRYVGYEENDFKNFSTAGLIKLNYSFYDSPNYKSKNGDDSICIGRNFLFVEMWGNSFLNYSVNYGRVLKKYTSFHTWISGGLGYKRAKGDWKETFVVPVSFNLTKGFKEHFWEVGLGLTYAHNGSQSIGEPDIEFKTSSSLLSTFRLAYRFQFSKYGIFIRPGFTGYWEILEFGDNHGIMGFFGVPGLSIGAFLDNIK